MIQLIKVQELVVSEVQESEMLAETYLKKVAEIDYALKVAKERKSQIEDDLYSVHAVRFDKEKVSGGIQTDTAMKIENAQKNLGFIDRHIRELEEAKRTAYDRMKSLPNIEHGAILISYYLNHKSVEEIAADLHVSRSTAYTRFGESKTEFAKYHKTWLRGVVSVP